MILLRILIIKKQHNQINKYNILKIYNNNLILKNKNNKTYYRYIINIFILIKKKMIKSINVYISMNIHKILISGLICQLKIYHLVQSLI